MSIRAEQAPAIVHQHNVVREERLALSVALGWGAGSLAMAVLFNSTNYLLLRFLTDHVGIAAGTAGLLLAIARLYDAVTDPVMGAISDRTNTRWGRRRPYLIGGGILCALSLVLMFSIPMLFGTDASAATVLMLLLFYATAYTIFNVPYMAMPAEMTSGYHERSRLMIYRVGAIGIGQILVGAIGPFLIVHFGGGAAGHSGMSLVLGAIIIVGSVICFGLTAKAPATFRSAQEARIGWGERFKTVCANKPFLWLLVLKVVLLLGVAVTGSTLAFLTVRILQVPDSVLGQLIIATTIGTIVSLPMWFWLSKRIGKKGTYICAASVFIVASLSWLLASPGEAPVVFLLRGFLKGVGSGGLILISQSMLPDVIEYDHLKTGLRREGLYAGFYTTVEKLAFALGASLTGLILHWSGYISSRGAHVEQPESAIVGIYICVAIAPAVAVALSVICAWLYPLNQKKLEKLRAEAAGQARAATAQ